MKALSAAWALIALSTGCYIEQDVLVTESESDKSALEPSLRYAYFREDPEHSRIHIRFTDYWNPCIADAQLQNQLRNASGANEQADAYRSLMPRRAWTADLYLQVAQWPRRSRTDLEIGVIPQVVDDGSGGTAETYGITCLMRQCPYETLCDRCLPEEVGATAGLSRTTDYLTPAYFRDSFSAERQQQYATSGKVTIDVWNPAVPLDLLEDTGEEGALDATAQISGSATFSLREVGQAADVGKVKLDFTASVCEPMQASFTRDLADFRQRDLNPYGPPACGTSPGAALWLGALGLAVLRRRTRASGSRPSSPTAAGAVAQPRCPAGSTSSKDTANA